MPVDFWVMVKKKMSLQRYIKSQLQKSRTTSLYFTRKTLPLFLNKRQFYPSLSMNALA